MKTFFKTFGHYIVGIAGIVCFAVLISNGSLTSKVGVPLITAIITAILTTGVTKRSSTSTVVTTNNPSTPSAVTRSNT